MIWVDALILAVIAFSCYTGYRRGLIAVTTDLLSLAVAFVIALLVYQPVAAWLIHAGRVAPPFAGALAITLIISIIQLVSTIVVGMQLRRLPKALYEAEWNRVGGAILGTARSALMVIFALILFSALPLSAATKGKVTDAAIPRLVAPFIGNLQQSFNQHFGKSLSDTINFFTVAPESEESIQLGFTTTDVRVDEVSERRMLDLVNHERTSRGLNALTQNDKARDLARNYSRDMLARGYFSHINPEGKSPFDRMTAAGLTFGAAGENLALAPTLDQAHVGLMNSPGHRANILSPDYKTVGIGVIDAGPYGLMVTQDFTD
jgi:uncharacterized protein YkwD